jgi:hypothetical protein
MSEWRFEPENMLDEIQFRALFSGRRRILTAATHGRVESLAGGDPTILFEAGHACVLERYQGDLEKPIGLIVRTREAVLLENRNSNS